MSNKYNEMSITELRALCAAREISVGGTAKQPFVDALLEFDGDDADFVSPTPTPDAPSSDTTPEQEYVETEEKFAYEDLTPEERRAKRKELGNQIRFRLGGKQRKGFIRRWVNDNSSGRLEQILDKGYDFVKEKDSNGRVKKVKQRAGVQENGEPMYAFLMEIREEWHREDQVDKQQEVDSLDAAMQSGQNTQGGSNEGIYVPKEGIKITRR